MSNARIDFDSSQLPIPPGASAGIPSTRPGTGVRGPLRSLVAIAAAAVVVLAAMAAALVAGASEPVHDVTLIARDMAFYLPGSTQPNPEIVVAPHGEVRLTLV
jgi:hypothetical protein